jgi:hypothetical protein
MADSYLVEGPGEAKLYVIQDILNTNDRLQITGHLVDGKAVMNLWKSVNGGEWTRLSPEEFVLEPRDTVLPEMLGGALIHFARQREGQNFLSNFNNELSFRELHDQIKRMLRGS